MSSAPMNIGEKIAFECVDVRRAVSGEYGLATNGEVFYATCEQSIASPILRRIEPARILAPGESKCLPVERAYLDARKLDWRGRAACTMWTKEERELQEHWLAEHAREQAAKRAKWIARRMASGRWVVEQESQVLWDSEWPGCSESAAQARAATLNALEAKP